MITGWYEMVRRKKETEFVSADVRQYKATTNSESYEMLSKDHGTMDMEQIPQDKPEPFNSPDPVISPISPVVTKSGRETPDYFGREARYKSPSRSFSSPKPPGGRGTPSWDSTSTHAQPAYYGGMDPLGMNKI